LRNKTRRARRVSEHRRRAAAARHSNSAPADDQPESDDAATIQINELASFNEGILRAGQLESTCDSLRDGHRRLAGHWPRRAGSGFPQFHTNSNGWAARHKRRPVFCLPRQPTLGGSGGFLVPNPGQSSAQSPENPMFRLVPLRFGRQNVVPSFEQQYGPIREVRVKYTPDGKRDGGVHQLWTVRGDNRDSTIPNCAITQLISRPNIKRQFVVSHSAANAGVGFDRIDTRQ